MPARYLPASRASPQYWAWVSFLQVARILVVVEPQRSQPRGVPAHVVEMIGLSRVAGAGKATQVGAMVAPADLVCNVAAEVHPVASRLRLHLDRAFPILFLMGVVRQPARRAGRVVPIGRRAGQKREVDGPAPGFGLLSRKRRQN